MKARFLKQVIVLGLGVLIPLQVMAADVVFKKSKVVVFLKITLSQMKRKHSSHFGDSLVAVQGLSDDYSLRTEIPYDKIQTMIYERSAHSRIAAAILINPLALFIKRKHHWFTFHYELEDSTKASILLRLDKKDEKRFRQVAPVRAGKNVENIIE